MKSIAMAFALVVAGCATTQSISEAERKSIRSVSVAKEVSLPARPVVTGRSTQKTGFWLGPIGQAVAMNDPNNSDVVQFTEYLSQHKIDIRDIVRQELLRQLAGSQAFSEVVPERGDATFSVAIESYGLGQGFSMSPTNAPVRPTLSVKATLTNAAGAVVWQNTGLVTNLSSLPAFPIAEYYSTPGKLEDGMRKAAEQAVKELLETLKPAS